MVHIKNGLKKAFFFFFLFTKNKIQNISKINKYIGFKAFTNKIFSRLSKNKNSLDFCYMPKSLLGIFPKHKLTRRLLNSSREFSQI